VSGTEVEGSEAVESGGVVARLRLTDGGTATRDGRDEATDAADEAPGGVRRQPADVSHGQEGRQKHERPNAVGLACGEVEGQGRACRKSDNGHPIGSFAAEVREGLVGESDG
jgi:hypothetical protein